jgi:hypothetical protein
VVNFLDPYITQLLKVIVKQVSVLNLYLFRAQKLATYTVKQAKDMIPLISDNGVRDKTGEDFMTFKPLNTGCCSEYPSMIDLWSNPSILHFCRNCRNNLATCFNNFVFFL